MELDYSLLTLLSHWYNTGIYEEFMRSLRHTLTLLFVFFMCIGVYTAKWAEHYFLLSILENTLV